MGSETGTSWQTLWNTNLDRYLNIYIRDEEHSETYCIGWSFFVSAWLWKQQHWRCGVSWTWVWNRAPVSTSLWSTSNVFHRHLNINSSVFNNQNQTDDGHFKTSANRVRWAAIVHEWRNRCWCSFDRMEINWNVAISQLWAPLNSVWAYHCRLGGWNIN